MIKREIDYGELEFPSNMDDMVTHEIGLLKCLKLVGELSGKSLLIKNSQVLLTDLVEEVEALEFLKKDLSKYNLFNTRATKVLYEYGKPRVNKIAYEGSHYFNLLCIAIKIYCKNKCKLIYHFSYNKSVTPLHFYRPYDFIMDDRLSDYSSDVSYIKTQEDLKELNKIYKNLIKLPINNGANYNRLLNAVVNTDRAQDEYWIHLKITLFFIALESLLSDSETELAYKISLRAACFLQQGSKDRKKEIFETLRHGYSIRSKFLHGAPVDLWKYPKGKKVEYSMMHDFPQELNSITSDILRKILTDNNLFDLFANTGNTNKIKAYLEDIVL